MGGPAPTRARAKKTESAGPAKPQKKSGGGPSPRAPGEAVQKAGPAVGLGRPQKLSVGKADDPFEREADRAADRVQKNQPAGPVSRMPATTPASTASAEPPAVQRAVADEEHQGEGPPTGALEGIVQKQATDVEPDLDTEEDVAARAVAEKDAGEPLAPGTRDRLERGLGTDLGDVRVHRGAAAQDAAGDLGARAFTHGSDIWLGRGESPDDIDLMGHEAAHVVQQRGAVQRAVVQRADGKPGESTAAAVAAGGGEGPVGDEKTGLRYPAQKKIVFSEIEVPSFKADVDHRKGLYESRTLRRTRGYTRGNPAQRDEWKKKIKTDTIKSKLKEKGEPAKKGKPDESSPQYVFKVPTRKGGKPFVLGTLDEVSTALTIPYWGGASATPETKFFDVDHIVELQLGDWPGDGWPNTLTNMELLESSANRSSGSLISKAIREKVRKHIEATPPTEATSPTAKEEAAKPKKEKAKGATAAAVEEIKAEYDLEFKKVTGVKARAVNPTDYWRPDQIEKGDHLVPVQASSVDEIGGKGKVALFRGPGGGVAKSFDWKVDDTGPLPPEPAWEAGWLKPFTILTKTFNVQDGAEKDPGLGTLTIAIPDKHKRWEPYAGGPLTISRIPGARFAGYPDREQLRGHLDKLKSKDMSPILIEAFDILPEDGIFVGGQLLPDVPLIGDAKIMIEVRGDEVRIFKTFTAPEFKVPKPLTVSGASLTLALSTEVGIEVSGEVDFAIERLGQGYLGASASTGAGFALEGRFNFDSSLFDPAEVSMKYEKDVLSLAGHLGIKEGKVRGIRSADITVAYSEGKLALTGSVKPSIPGVEQGDLSITYSETEGLAIAAALQLKKDIPGIKSGSADVKLEKRPDAEAWKVAARGKAEPAIPGVAATLEVAYDDGAFTIEGNAAYEKGMLEGSIQLGATNRVVDADGRPTGDVTDTLTAYGGGTVTIRIAPWLQGTIGVRLKPNGEIVVSGEIGLPAALELFPEKAIEKDIFTIGIDIPILGVAAAGQRIGIFATISGGLKARAGIGPGQLQELKLGITYNPDREADTHVTGSAALHIPASAGLRLFVRGGLGVGIPIVSASAGIELGGELGLAGAVHAGVTLDWTPARGLVLDAAGEIYVEPKFRFDINAFVLVELDLLIKTITLYEEHWELAAFEYGSGLRFGIRFPIHYEEGKPFELSLSNVEFITPSIDTKELLGGLVKQLVG